MGRFVQRICKWILSLWQLIMIRIYKHRSSAPEHPAFGQAIRKQEFLLQSGTHFLNHGSWGTIPKRVHEAQVRLLKEADASFDMWRGRISYNWNQNLPIVASQLGANVANLAFVENTTTGIQNILSSLQLEAGDVIIYNTWTYGAMKNQMDILADKIPGVKVVELSFSIPIRNKSEIIQKYKDAISTYSQIKLALVDHISSSPSVMFPITDIISVLKPHGIMVLIDGAHCPGQVPLNLEAIGADFYVGNLHKWFFSARGCAIMWVDPKYHQLVKPAVMSHVTSPYPNDMIMAGTRDLTPYFCAKDAVAFYDYIGSMSNVTAYNTKLLDDAISMVAAAWGTTKLQIPHVMECPFMKCVEIPLLPGYTYQDAGRLNGDLRNRFNILAFIFAINDKLYFRLSVNVYCTITDYEALRDAIKTLRQEEPSHLNQVASRARKLNPEDDPRYLP